MCIVSSTGSNSHILAGKASEVSALYLKLETIERDVAYGSVAQKEEFGVQSILFHSRTVGSTEGEGCLSSAGKTSCEKHAVR